MKIRVEPRREGALVARVQGVVPCLRHRSPAVPRTLHRGEGSVATRDRAGLSVVGDRGVRRVLVTLLALGLSASSAWASCPAAGVPATLDQLVDRVESEGLGFAFIGERHGVGPVKRFAVDLANRLVERGHDVGLYVEGFRVGCALDDPACNRLAAAFNRGAYRSLLDHSKAVVHPIDPVSADERAARMASVIAAGGEAIRVVLVGGSHVVLAGEPEAEHRVFGGGMRYPDPGDLVEAFPRESRLTIGLETVEHVEGPYALRVDGCSADYILQTERTGSY